MDRIVNIGVKCTTCGKIGHISGDINGSNMIHFLKTIGWFCGNHVVMCPECYTRAEQRMIQAIMNGEAEDDGDAGAV